jgi:hypothetical protein
MLPSPTHTHRHVHLDTSATPHTFAVFAAHLATSCRFCHPPCRFLPRLPPITRNVKLPHRAKWLEFRVWEETVPDTKSKSGKNGNVDHANQHCHQDYPRHLCWEASSESALRRSVKRIGACHPRLPLVFMPGRVSCHPGEHDRAKAARGVQSGGRDMKVGATDDGE